MRGRASGGVRNCGNSFAEQARRYGRPCRSFWRWLRPRWRRWATTAGTSGRCSHPLLRIRRATTASDYAHVSAHFREYVDALGFPLTFQDFERELAQLPSEYGPPGGAAWIAFVENSPAGAVGLRRFDAASGEMKRMYVRPAYRGRGIARALAEELIVEAREIGYERVLLDTIASMTEAIALYRALGFVEIPAYRHNPMPGATYFALTL